MVICFVLCSFLFYGYIFCALLSLILWLYVLCFIVYYFMVVRFVLYCLLFYGYMFCALLFLILWLYVLCFIVSYFMVIYFVLYCLLFYGYMFCALLFLILWLYVFCFIVSYFLIVCISSIMCFLKRKVKIHSHETWKSRVFVKFATQELLSTSMSFSYKCMYPVTMEPSAGSCISITRVVASVGDLTCIRGHSKGSLQGCNP